MKIVMEFGTSDLNQSLKSEKPSLLKVKFIVERMLRILSMLHSKGSSARLD